MWQIVTLVASDKSDCPVSTLPCNGCCCSWMLISSPGLERPCSVHSCLFETSMLLCEEARLDGKRIRYPMEREPANSSTEAKPYGWGDLTPSGPTQTARWLQLMDPWWTQLTHRIVRYNNSGFLRGGQRKPLRNGDMSTRIEEGSCYGLNVYVLSKCLCRSLNPSVAVCEDGASKEGTEVTGGHEVGPREGHVRT